MPRSSTSIGAIGVGLIIAVVATAGWTMLDDHSRAQDAAQPAARKTLPTPVVDTHHLMELFNKQVYIYMKKSVAKQPADDDGWSQISDRGLQVAEVANLVALREVEDSEQWLEAAAGLQQAGIELADAAKSHQWDATQASYRKVIQQCNDCHQARAPDEAPQLKP